MKKRWKKKTSEANMKQLLWPKKLPKCFTYMSIYALLKGTCLIFRGKYFSYLKRRMDYYYKNIHGKPVSLMVYTNN